MMRADGQAVVDVLKCSVGCSENTEKLRPPVYNREGLV